MISILIPVYNYSLRPLLERLAIEIESFNSPVEVIILDDASTIKMMSSENNLLSEELQFSYLENNTNLGRTASRQKLAEKAAYDHLIFLDSDVLPVKNNFLSNFEEVLDKEDLVFGGIAYQHKQPKQEHLLHWLYGKNREVKTLKQRKEQPVLTVNSGCLCVKKPVFLKVNSQMTSNHYGLDNYFKQLLEEQNVSVLHIDNQVFHLGLESTEVFINKMLKSVETTYVLEQKGLMLDTIRPLQKAYLNMKKFGVIGKFERIFKGQEKAILKNLHSKRPSLRLFDMYRLHYYITLKK